MEYSTEQNKLSHQPETKRDHRTKRGEAVFQFSQLKL